MKIEYLGVDGKTASAEVEILTITSVDTPHIICFDKSPGVTQLVTSEEKVFPELLSKAQRIFKHKDLRNA